MKNLLTYITTAFIVLQALNVFGRQTDPITGEDNVCSLSVNEDYSYNWSSDSDRLWTVLSGGTEVGPRNLTTVTVDWTSTGTHTLRFFNGQFNTDYSVTVHQAGTVSDVQFCKGSIDDLSLVGTTGDVLRWEYSTDDGANWAHISSTSENLPYSSMPSEGLYRALVNNGTCGNNYSSEANVTIDETDGGEITGAGAGTFCMGTNVTLDLENYHGSIIHWETRINDGTWVPNTTLAGEDSHTFPIAVDKLEVKIYVQDGLCNAEYSEPATIYGVTPPIAGNLNGGNTFCDVASGSLSLASIDADEFVVKWEKSTDDGATWPIVLKDAQNNDYTGTSYSLAGIEEPSAKYRVVIGRGSCATDITSEAEVIVNPTPVVTLNAQTTTESCASASAHVTQTSNVNGVQTWWKSTDDGDNWTEFTPNWPESIDKTTWYEVRQVTSGCSEVSSQNIIKYNVYPNTVAGTLSATSEFCGSASGNISISGHTGDVVRWERQQQPVPEGTDDWEDMGRAGLEHYDLSSEPIGEFKYRAVVKSGVCTPLTTPSTTVEIYAPSDGGTLSVTGGTLVGGIATICDNEQVILTLNNMLGVIVGWEVSENGEPFEPYTGFTDPSNTIQSVTVDKDLEFKALVQNGICGIDESTIAKINHDALSDAGNISGGGTFCFSASGTISLTGYTGTITQWEYSTDFGANWSPLEEGGNPVTGPSYNYTNITVPIKYKVWVQNGQVCEPVFIEEEVYVHPDDAGELSGNDVHSCTGTANVDLDYTSPGSLGGTFEWQYSENGGSFIPMDPQPTNSYTATINTTTAYRVEYSAPGCTPRVTDPVTYTVIDIPTGAGGTLNSLKACTGADFNIQLTGNIATLTGWEIQEYIFGQTPDWDPITDSNLSDDILPFTNFSNFSSDIKAILDYQGCTVESTVGTITLVQDNTVIKDIKGGRKVLRYDNEGFITYKNSDDVVQYWEQSEDNGSTWTVITDQTTAAIPYFDLEEDMNYRVTVQDGIGCNVLTSPEVAITVIDQSLNSVETKGFSVSEDGTEKLVRHDKAYFDFTGNALQSQTKNLTDNQVLASQTIDNDYGRPVLSTLSAPINSSEFDYKERFVTTIAGDEYDNTNFDGNKKGNPDPVGTTMPGTLGWYYSNNNTMEPYVAATDYPYSRTDYYEDGSGEVKRAAFPGDELRMGKGHEAITKILPVGLNELKHYLEIRNLILQTNTTEIGQIYKQVSIDPNGQETVKYIGENGDQLASAIVKGSNSLPLTITRTGDELEFHVPTGNSNINVTVSGSSDKYIYNKLTESSTPIEVLNAAQTSVSLPPGIYKMTGGNHVSYVVNYTDFAYKFYDNAGRLVAAIAPNGLADILLNEDPPMSLSELSYVTYITYDFKGQIIRLVEPDSHVTEYIYRKDGSIRFSQNALQKQQNKFSYTTYDNAGRSVEFGEYNGTGNIVFNSTEMNDLLENTGSGEFSTGERSDWVEIFYDLPAENLPTELIGYSQAFTDGRVSYTQNNDVTTWYSYDEFGRVSWLAMKYHSMDNRIFTLDYEYDFSGNVLTRAFQKSKFGEAFYHHYTYDKDNKLITVATSVNGDLDEAYLHASYSYYLHGPLKRVEYATDLQGIDYVYTVDGYLKSINNPNNTFDPGADGTGNNFEKDVFGMNFDYYNGDYTRSGTNITNVNLDETFFANQYGGNIRATAWGRDLLMIPRKYDLDVSLSSYDPDNATVTAGNRITLEPGFDTNNSDFEGVVDPEGTYIPPNETPNLHAYSYDDKYQLKSAVYGKASSFNNTSNENAVRNIQYDENGNILTLDRYNDKSELIDDFNYHYEPNKNLLNSVDNYVTDYDYNIIGQITAVKGRAGTLDQYMKYDVTGKVVGIYADENHNDLKYLYKYDERGFRIMRRNNDNNHETWYVRDASGNIISIYEKNVEIEQTELPIYAINKIGTAFRNQSRYKYNYELTDHLGNVRSVVSKLKFMETATMEPEYASNEESIFANIFATRQTDQLFNTTYNGDHVSRLNGAYNQIVGPALSLAVNKDDVVKMDVNALYIGNTTDQGIISGLFGVLSTAFNLTSVGETAQAHTAVSNALSGLAAVPGNTGTVPKAYIQYLLFDKDYNYIQPPEGQDPYVKITSNAQGSHENLALEVDIEHDGYIYIYVVNESLNDINVFFDDLTVTQLGVDITQSTDYYPFGSKMNYWQKEYNRYGFQGGFAEEDAYTGLNHFQFRKYDPKIGRWNSPDLERQHYSPYLAFSNNPILFVDPNGLTDWPSVGSEAWNFTAGVLEFAGGLITSPTGVGVAVAIDGGVRATMAFSNMLIAFNSDSEDEFNNRKLPSNIGEWIGAGVDHFADRDDKLYQNIGGLSNDFASLVVAFKYPPDLSRVTNMANWTTEGRVFYQIVQGGTNGLDILNITEKLAEGFVIVEPVMTEKEYNNLINSKGE